MNHTPTPWTLYLDDDNHVVAVVNDSPKLSERRIIVRDGVGNSRTQEENDANQRFIVRACNAHDELVAAAKYLTEWFDKEEAGPQYPAGVTRDMPEGDAIWSSWWNEQLELCRMAKQSAKSALAKAEGK